MYITSIVQKPPHCPETPLHCPETPTEISLSENPHHCPETPTIVQKPPSLSRNPPIVQKPPKADEQASDLVPAKLAFAVEGWNTNGKALLPFKTGAFKPGLPIQIYLPKWEGFVPITTFGQNISWFWTIMIALSQPVMRVNVKMLPVYYPNEGKHIQCAIVHRM